MARPRDIVKWLTGFIGYASLPRPDFRQAANRLKTATNVWMGGTTGVTRRLGMSFNLAPASTPIGSAVTCPAAYGDATYSAVLVYGGSSPLYVSSAGVPASYREWYYAYGHFSQAPTINGKAHLITTGPAFTPSIVDVSRAQLPVPAAPTAVDTGVGAYPTVQRYYRVQWNTYSANQYDIRGPVGPARSFTPSGAGTGVVITKPTGSGWTHWLLWGSSDDFTYYLIARTAMATTTVTDSTAGASGGALADNYLALNNTTLTDNFLGTPVRRVGMIAVAGFPVPADTGVGAYAATARYYRVRWTEQIAGVTKRRSEPSASVAFTPSGTGTGVTVTRPSAPASDWGATHWELEASTDNVTFYVLNAIVITAASTTDSLDPVDYSTLTLSEAIGIYTVPPNARTAVADRDRVLYGGGWNTNFSRIWYTPVLGTTDVSDDERVPVDNYFDVDPHGGDEIRALVGPVFGSILVFKRRSIFRLTRTGNSVTPYEITNVAQGVGCDGPSSVCVAPGPTSEEAVYFVNALGAWRYDAPGGTITRLNDDLQAPWEGETTTTGRVVYYPTRQCVLFGNYAYSLVTGGWTYQNWTYGDTTLQLVGRFLSTYDTHPVLLMPVYGSASDGLYTCDRGTGTTDVSGAAYVAEVRTNRFTLTEPTQLWRPVRMRVWGDGGALEWNVYVNNETTPRVTVPFTLGDTQDGVDLSEYLRPGPVEWLSLSLKDRRTASTWTLDAIEVTGIPQEPIP